MRRPYRLLPLALLWALPSACELGPREDDAARVPRTTAATPIWRAEITGDGVALTFATDRDDPLFRIACPDDPARIEILATRLTPIGSEERFSFSVDGEPFVFVADLEASVPAGVLASTAIEEAFLERFEAPTEVTGVYGAQRLGPYPPPGAHLVGVLLATCRAVAAG